MKANFIEIVDKMIEAVKQNDFATVQELTKSLSHDEMCLIRDELQRFKKQRSKIKNIKTRVY